MISLGPIKSEISSDQRVWSEFTPENRMCKIKNCRQTLFACSPQNVGVCKSYLAAWLNNKQSPSSCPWTYVFSHPPLLTDIAREMRPIVPFLVREHKHSLFHPILENFPDTDERNITNLACPLVCALVSALYPKYRTCHTLIDIAFVI